MMWIPEGLRGIMEPMPQQPTVYRDLSLSSSSLDTVIHHADMSGPHVANIAEAYSYYRPRIVAGPERRAELRLLPSISSSSSEERANWDCFYQNVMVSRTLSQCRRATLGLKRHISQRPRISTVREGLATREADGRPLLNRSGTSKSCVSYRYLEGPTQLVVTNP